MSGLASVFPPPPPYYKKYTEAAWSEYQSAKDAGNADESELAPPPPPDTSTQKIYRNFGSIWNVHEHLPSLEESGITQLYTPGSERSAATLVPELKRLSHNVLLTYLALLQTSSSDPVQFVARVENLRALFINMHHLSNTYRPVQSKENLISKMKSQIEAARSSAASMRETNERISRQIEALEARLPQQSTQAVPMVLDVNNGDTSVWDGFDLDVDVHLAQDEGAIE